MCLLSWKWVHVLRRALFHLWRMRIHHTLYCCCDSLFSCKNCFLYRIPSMVSISLSPKQWESCCSCVRSSFESPSTTIVYRSYLYQLVTYGHQSSRVAETRLVVNGKCRRRGLISFRKNLIPVGGAIAIIKTQASNSFSFFLHTTL